MKEKRPGLLSEDLKRALGMPDGAPPPWLLNMQRFGPPPSYPNLKIPGLNAPIPEGARYGYHPGGWGKPPVDEYGRPIYGDAFGTNPPPPEMPSQPIGMFRFIQSFYRFDSIERYESITDYYSFILFSSFFLCHTDKKHWGELEAEEEEEEEIEEAEEEATEPTDEGPTESGLQTPSGMATPSGMDTPETLELRKAGSRRAATAADDDDSNKQLYQVIPETQVSVGGALMGSSHRYVLPGGEKKVPKAKNAVDIIRSQATEKLDITLAPTEVENLEELTEEVLRKKYEQAQADKHQPKEDVSDILAENLQKKKRKKDSDKDGKHKNKKEFKF